MIETQTSGQALAEKLMTVIAANPYLAQRKVSLETDEGKVTLRGTVGSYYQKQMAQESLRRLDGVQEIQNLLEVNWGTRA